MTDVASSADTGPPPEADPGLAQLTAQLEGIDDVPLDERPALLERANAALVEALAELEEV